MTHTSTAILRPVYQYYKKTYSGRPVTASRVSCVSIYPCAIYSSSEPVRLLCKLQNSPAESYVCTLLLLVGLGSFSTFLIKPSTCSKVAQSLGVAVLAVTLDSTSTFYDGRV